MNEQKTLEAFYDFEKAYDNVSHEYLKKLMEIYKFPKQSTVIIGRILKKAKI